MAIRPITTPRRLSALNSRQRATYTRTLQALRLRDEKGYSLEEAARRAGTKPETVRAYQGDVWVKRGGRWRTRPAHRRQDRLLRNVRVPTTSGVRSLVVDSRDADLVRDYRWALRRYVNAGDDQGLEDFEGQTIGGYQLETDPLEIDIMIGSGELDPDEIGSGATAR